MFYETLENHWRYLVASGLIDRNASAFILIAAGITVAYASWYTWTFKLALLWRPSEPKPLPYLVPFVGHARWFFADRDALFTHARRYYKNEPCALTIVGVKLYMVTLPQHVSEVYKKSATLSFDPFIRDFHKSYGMSPIGVNKMWEVPMAHEKHLDPTGRKNLLQHSIDYHRIQLLPGPHLENLNERFLTRIEYGTRWATVPKSCILSSAPDEMVVSLYKWCGEVMVDASTRAFFGDALLDTEPAVIHDFLEFDEHSWMLLLQYPSFLAKVMSAPRERVLESFDRYVSLPPERKKDAAYYTQALVAEQIKAGMSNRDIAAGLQMFHFAMNANVYRMCFWLVAHTIYEPSLMSTIRNEIGPAIRGGKLDINYLIEDQNCPMLNAAFNETLRYTSAAASGRVVLSPTNIGGKTLYPGAKVYMPYRQSHFSDEVFGSRILEFDPQRFVSNKELAKNPAYRPFGGGSQYCSGRFLARREVIGFLAFILDQFDISLGNIRRDDTPESGAQRFPRMDSSKQNIGVISPVPGDDIIVSIKPKKKDSF